MAIIREIEEIDDTEDGSNSEGENCTDFMENDEHIDDEVEEELASMFRLLWFVLKGTFGVGLLIIIITKYPVYLHILHENQLWFSNIKEVEREISFRTEQGFYYTYFKNILSAKTWLQGVRDLQYDNYTEHGRTINVIHRFNIAPEIFLSAIHRSLKLSESPIMMYVWSVFSLHGVYLATLCGMSWMLSGSPISGAITTVLFIVHRIDTTRVNYTIPLRESFAIPILFLQIFLTCIYLRNTSLRVIKIIGIFFLTLFGLLSWQFTPFILLCQQVVIVALCRLHLIPSSQACKISLSIGSSLLVCCVIQGFSSLVLSSPALSMMIPATYLCISTLSPEETHTESYFFSRGLVRLAVVFMELMICITCTIGINWTIKEFLNVDADSHVYELLLAKLQLGDKRNFDSRMYMCNHAFYYLDIETLNRLCGSGLLIVYFLAMIVLLTSIVRQIMSVSSNESPPSSSLISGRQDLVYFVSLSSLWCVLALLILRLKVLWLPTVCVLAGTFIGCTDIYEKIYSVFRKCFRSNIKDNESIKESYGPVVLKRLLCLLFLSITIYRYWQHVAVELWPDELLEFWDPDTVELLEWVSQHTAPSAVFAGSMQLMSAIKLSTGRPITNHPHYEDPWIRHRTKLVYQMYGHTDPASLWHIVHDTGASYIVLEDSICLEHPQKDSPELCRLIDIVDLHNGHDSTGQSKIPGLVTPKHSRFCDEIRHMSIQYKKYFSLVMSNKTFRVYRIAKNKNLLNSINT
ncbi:unnamed protein product [Meganyctiphanes norvegica]|uniref:C-mannosyltransferase DPY19L3 n=1 Tax=Meganyctiphanes norvegica TaxID=48144 RepID=A0AAV2R8K6_MEGNR